MKNILPFLGFILGASALLAQQHDNVWPGGFTEYPGTPFNGNYLLRFDNGMPTVAPANLNMNFESTVAAFSDSTGQLRFYSNGCAIANAQGNILLHSDEINPGVVRAMTCPENGYISPLGAVFLPWPGREKTNIILLHMAVDYQQDRKLTYGPLYASVIANTGPGIMQAVNEKLLDVVYAPTFSSRTFEPFSIVRHGNGRDWWVIIPEYRKNKYHTFLLSPNWFEEMPVQTIGPEMKCRRIGSSTFSPDGTRYARQQNCGVTVMDFDRCTGKFSSPVWLPLPAGTFGGGSVAFSNDGTELITDGYLTLFKADLNQGSPAFDTLIAPEQILGRSLHYFQRGPDGNLYFSLLNRNFQMPVLSNPFESDDDFNPQGIQLPNFSVRGLPNFPNYRLYDFPNSPCDTLGINTPTSAIAPEIPQQPTMVFPNPFNDHITVFLSDQFKGSVFRLYDHFGRIVYDGPISSEYQYIDGALFPAGMYRWEIINSDHSLAAGKIVKIVR